MINDSDTKGYSPREMEILFNYNGVRKESFESLPASEKMAAFRAMINPIPELREARSKNNYKRETEILETAKNKIKPFLNL